MSRYEWNSKIILKTAAAGLAVSLDDVKEYLYVTDTASDSLITAMIESATLMFEKHTWREALDKTFTLYLDFFPVPRRYGDSLEGLYNTNTIEVKRSKLKSISSIKYYTDSVLTVFDSSLYIFSKDDVFSKISLLDADSSWPQTDVRKQAVEIEFIAGHGADDTEVPVDMADCIKRIVSCLYSNRGDCAASKVDLEAICPGIGLNSIQEI